MGTLFPSAVTLTLWGGGGWGGGAGRGGVNCPNRLLLPLFRVHCWADAKKRLSCLVDVAAIDPHVALSLLCLSGVNQNFIFPKVDVAQSNIYLGKMKF